MDGNVKIKFKNISNNIDDISAIVDTVKKCDDVLSEEFILNVFKIIVYILLNLNNIVENKEEDEIMGDAVNVLVDKIVSNKSSELFDLINDLDLLWGYRIFKNGPVNIEQYKNIVFEYLYNYKYLKEYFLEK